MISKRILVVEDYQHLRDLMKLVLGELGGHSVETAAGGEIAQRLIGEQSFDLVVLDIGMPGCLNGQDIAALARLRLRCPILFITGRDLADADCSDYLEPGDRLLRKPFRMDVLLDEVAGLFKLDAAKARKASKWLRAREPRLKLMPPR